MTTITCVYRGTTEGRRAMLFSADLLKLVGGSGSSVQKLHIYVEPGNIDAQRINNAADEVQKLLATEKARILAEVAAVTGLTVDALVITNGDTDGIVVDHAMAFERADLDVLFPSLEKSILARGKGPLLVPFGDSNTALPAANIAISLGRALALPVVFYHTTWKDQSITDDDQNPEDHMCQGAREIAQLLKTNATAAGIKFSFAIETADDVAEGILHCALRLGVRLIVMPRSAKTTIGCYVNQALAKSPIPLLAVAAKPGRQQ